MHQCQDVCKGKIADVRDGGCFSDGGGLSEHHSCASRSLFFFSTTFHSRSSLYVSAEALGSKRSPLRFPGCGVLAS